MWFSRRRNDEDFHSYDPIPPPPQVPKRKGSLELVSWKQLARHDFILKFSDGVTCRGWDYWWKDAEDATYLTGRIAEECRRCFTLIEWGRLDHLKIQ